MKLINKIIADVIGIAAIVGSVVAYKNNGYYFESISGRDILDSELCQASLQLYRFSPDVLKLNCSISYDKRDWAWINYTDLGLDGSVDEKLIENQTCKSVTLDQNYIERLRDSKNFASLLLVLYDKSCKYNQDSKLCDVLRA